MFCSNCGNRTKVVESRSFEEGTFRKHICKSCGNVMYTEEYESDDHEGLSYIRMMLKRQERARKKK